MTLVSSVRRVIIGLGLLMGVFFASYAMAGANKNQVCISNDVGSGFTVEGWFISADSGTIQTCCSGQTCHIPTAQTKCCTMTGTRSGKWGEGSYFDYTIYQGNGSGKVYPDLGEICHFSGQLANVHKSKQCKSD